MKHQKVGLINTVVIEGSTEVAAVSGKGSATVSRHIYWS